MGFEALDSESTAKGSFLGGILRQTEVMRTILAEK